MIRIAAVGDVHFDKNSRHRLSRHFINLKSIADVFLIAGDLTQVGSIEEILVLAEDLQECPIPVIAVLGNHDYQNDQEHLFTQILNDAGVTVLDGSSTVIQVGQYKVGIAGTKGFGGGFVGASGSDFGEQEMKHFMRHSKLVAKKFQDALSELNTDYKIALLHYSPTAQTLLGEKKEIYPFLGCYYLAEAIDYARADIAFHGHAHGGIEKGETPGGCPVRNVAQPVIRHAFNIYTLEPKSM